MFSVATLVLAVACAPDAPPDWAGALPKASAAPRKPPPPPKRVDDWDAVLALPPVPLGEERPVSLGHGGGRYTYTVHTEPELQERYLHPTRDTVFPVGATLLERTFDAKSGEAGPLFLMRKQAQGWSFAQLDAGGFPQTRDVERCRRCHAEARADSIFGAPFGG